MNVYLIDRAPAERQAREEVIDRLLISGFYIVPFYYAPEQWIAYSARLGRPGKTPLFGVATEAWWRRPE